MHVFEISCFHFNAEETTVYAFGVALFIMNTGYITATIGYDTGNFFQIKDLIPFWVATNATPCA